MRENDVGSLPVVDGQQRPDEVRGDEVHGAELERSAQLIFGERCFAGEGDFIARLRLGGVQQDRGSRQREVRILGAHRRPACTGEQCAAKRGDHL